MKIWETTLRRSPGIPVCKRPSAVLNDYYDVYVTQPDDAKWRLDNMHETYLEDMHSQYVYPNVFMSIDDTNKVSQYDTDIKKYAEQKKADWILNGALRKNGTAIWKRWKTMVCQITWLSNRSTLTSIRSL